MTPATSLAPAWRTRLVGFACVALALAADQGHKLWMLNVYGIEANAAVRLGSEAQPYEIRITDSARAALLHTPGISFEDVSKFPHPNVYRVQYDLRETTTRSE